MVRNIIGLLIAIPAPAILMSIISREAHLSLLGALLVPFVFPVAIGVYLWFKRQGWLSVWAIQLASLLIGVAFYLLFSLGFPSGLVGAIKQPTLSLVFVGYASISGFVYWAISKR